MRTLETRTGAELPVLGQGTWGMGEDVRRRPDEVAALRLGLDLGLTVVDTAEMYGHGGAEEVVGRALRGCRDGVFLVSKVLPEKASRQGTIGAAEASLRRLATDRIDLYLLHWRGPQPLEETLQGLVRLQQDGKILHYGVSNFDVDDLEECEELPGGRATCANPLLYNLQRRGPEERILPWCRDRGMAVIAYSPLEQARLRISGALERVARRRGRTPHQVALAWTLRHEGVVTIPKACTQAHVRENAAAIDLVLTPEDVADLEVSFPPPQTGAPLETL
jgi:diketogulonate reductase-like aldo/keto reductase